MRPVCSVVLIGLFCVAIASSASAQYNAAIDVSKCYSSLIQRSELWENDENTQYRLMASMTKEDYENLQAHSKGSAFIKGIPVEASWDAAREQATKLLQQRNEELLRTQHTYSAVCFADTLKSSVRCLISHPEIGIGSPACGNIFA